MDPEKFTLRFVKATGDGPIFAPSTQRLERSGAAEKLSQETISSEEWKPYRFTDEAIPLSEKNMLLSEIEQSNPTYTELVSMPIEMGKEFISDNGMLSGKVWLGTDCADLTPGSRALARFELQCDPHPITFDDTPFGLKIDEWVGIGLGNAEKSEWILVKLYPPRE